MRKENFIMGKSTYQHEGVLKSVVATLSNEKGLKDICHKQWHGEPLPSQTMIAKIVELSRSVLFPGFFGEEGVNSFNMEYIIGLQCEQLRALLEVQIHACLIIEAHAKNEDADDSALQDRARDIAMLFMAELPEIRRALRTDVEATYLGDPAAVSTEEVIYCYPAFRAICNHRVAHALVNLGVPILPRMISENAHSETGIDIHPAATIGDYFTIDHGTGVVIGATAIIGHHVKLYQGVTLGAKSFDLDDAGNPIKGIPRHPILGNGVVVYSNASILGRVHIGDNAVIGGNLWVTTDVEPGEKITQAKAKLNNKLSFKNSDDK